MRRGCSRPWWATTRTIDAVEWAGPPAAQCSCRRCGVQGRERIGASRGATDVVSHAATGGRVRCLASSCRPARHAAAPPRWPAASAAAPGVGACRWMRRGRRPGRRSGRVGTATQGVAVGTFSSARHTKSPIGHTCCPACRAFSAERRAESPARRTIRAALGTFTLVTCPL
jgi:hypothetical protein